jgi:hypothetical protein
MILRKLAVIIDFSGKHPILWLAIYTAAAAPVLVPSILGLVGEGIKPLDVICWILLALTALGAALHVWLNKTEPK